MTSNSDFPLAKKRGRPLGSKNKRTRTVAGKKYTFKKKAFKQPKINQSDAHKILLTTLVQELTDRIKSLEHQSVGYRAVISYLEHKLGTK
jgi:hypothetical protein